MNIRYIVELSEEERTQLHELTGGGQARVRRVKRAQILLAAEHGHGDAAVAALVGVGTSTVYRTKRRFVEASQMLLGVMGLAVRGKPVPSRRRTIARPRPLVAYIAPGARRRRLAGSGGEYLGRTVWEDAARSEPGGIRLREERRVRGRARLWTPRPHRTRHHDSIHRTLAQGR